VFKSRDGIDVLISIQNDREWRRLAAEVMDDKALAADPDFATVSQRTARRADTDGKVAAAFARHDAEDLMLRLEKADIAFARVSDLKALAEHPHLRRVTIDSPSGPISYPTPAAIHDVPRRPGSIPALGQHSEKIRAEFG
jgi:formyl-CoA transferase